jgi:hypothetical protein
LSGWFHKTFGGDKEKGFKLYKFFKPTDAKLCAKWVCRAAEVEFDVEPQLEPSRYAVSWTVLGSEW